MKKYILAIITIASLMSAKAQTLEEALKAEDFDKYETARNILLQVIAKEPNKGENYYYLGQIYGSLFKPDSALWAFNTGVKNNPTSPACYAGLGGLLMEENKLADAKVQFDKALSFSKERNGTYSDVKAMVWVAENMIASENKLVADAEALMRNALEVDKSNYDVLVTMGDVFLEINNGGEAANNYERAIDLQKTNPKAYSRVANIWVKVRNIEAAQKDLNRALSIDPNYAPALKLQAELYYQQRKFEKAKETYKSYLLNSEASFANRLRFAQILFRAKEYDEALVQIEELQKTDKSNLFLYRMLAYSYYEVGGLKNDTSKCRTGLTALEYFMSKVDEKKILTSDYEYMGKLQSKFKGYDTLAINNFKKVLSLDADKIEMYQELAKVYNKMKRFDEAANNLQIFIASSKKVTVADYFLLGKAYYFGKKFVSADSAFSIVNTKSPNYADAYYYRGMSQASINTALNDTIGKFCFEKYLSLININDPAVAEKQKNNIVQAYDYLGSYCYKNSAKGEERNCKTYFEKILILEPGNKKAAEFVKTIK